jgi:hypothetical protein
MGAFIAFAFIAAYSVASGYWNRPAVAPVVVRQSRFDGYIAAQANNI